MAVGTGEDHGGALEERPEELPDRHVEAGRRLLQHPVVGAQPVGALHPGEPVDDGAVGDDHALGAAGGTGGVDEVCGVVGAGRGDGPGLRGLLLRVEEEDARAGGPGQPIGRAGERDHRRRSAVAEHVGHAVRRIVQVEGQIGRARLQYAEQRHHQFRRTGHGDRDELPGGRRDAAA